MICLSCAIALKIKLDQNSFRLGVCQKCGENRVVGEGKK
jgi:hypothetical protein